MSKLRGESSGKSSNRMTAKAYRSLFSTIEEKKEMSDDSFEEDPEEWEDPPQETPEISTNATAPLENTTTKEPHRIWMTKERAKKRTYIPSCIKIDDVIGLTSPTNHPLPGPPNELRTREAARKKTYIPSCMRTDEVMPTTVKKKREKCIRCGRYHEEVSCKRRKVLCPRCGESGHSTIHCPEGYPGWRR